MSVLTKDSTGKTMRWHVFIDGVSGAGTGRRIYSMILGEKLATKECFVYPGRLTVEELAKKVRRASKCDCCGAAGGVVHEEIGRAVFVVQHSMGCVSW